MPEPDPFSFFGVQTGAPVLQPSRTAPLSAAMEPSPQGNPFTFFGVQTEPAPTPKSETLPRPEPLDHADEWWITKVFKNAAMETSVGLAARATGVSDYEPRELGFWGNTAATLLSFAGDPANLLAGPIGRFALAGAAKAIGKEAAEKFVGRMALSAIKPAVTFGGVTTARDVAQGKFDPLHSLEAAGQGALLGPARMVPGTLGKLAAETAVLSGGDLSKESLGGAAAAVLGMKLAGKITDVGLNKLAELAGKPKVSRAEYAAATGIPVEDVPRGTKRVADANGAKEIVDAQERLSTVRGDEGQVQQGRNGPPGGENAGGQDRQQQGMEGAPVAPAVEKPPPTEGQGPEVPPPVGPEGPGRGLTSPVDPGEQAADVLKRIRPTESLTTPENLLPGLAADATTAETPPTEIVKGRGASKERIAEVQALAAASKPGILRTAFKAISDAIPNYDDPAYGPEAALRDIFGEGNRRAVQVARMLSKLRSYFQGRPSQENRTDRSNYELGSHADIPAKVLTYFKAQTQRLADLYTEWRSLRGKDTTLDDLIPNYLARAWELTGKPGPVPGEWIELANTEMRKVSVTPLRGDWSFTHERVLRNILEGLNRTDIREITDNPVDLELLKTRSLLRAIEAQKLINQHGVFVAARGTPEPGYRIPEAAKTLRDPSLVVYAPKPKFGVHVAGYQSVPERIANFLDNRQSKGLAGNPTYDFLKMVSNSMTSINLLSYAHIMGNAVRMTGAGIGRSLALLSSGHPLKAGWELTKAPFEPILGPIRGVAYRRAFYGEKPLPKVFRFLVGNIDPVTLRAMQAANFNPTSENWFRTSFAKGFADNYRKLKFAETSKEKLIAAANVGRYSPFAVMELVMRPVPGYTAAAKVGAFQANLRVELERLGHEPTPGEFNRLAAKVSDLVDDHLGLMNYENVNAKRYFKDLAFLMIRSPGWSGGTARYLAAAGEDLNKMGERIKAGEPWMTQRMAHVFGMGLGAAVAGSVYQMLFTGTFPDSWENAIYFWNGRFNPDGTKQRESILTDVKDWVAYKNDPLGTVRNKLSPIVSMLWEVGVTNRNYYGDMIRNPHDPAWIQIQQALWDAASRVSPFTVSAAKKSEQRGQGAVEAYVKPAVGILPAPTSVQRTPALRLLHEYAMSQTHARTPEEAQAMQEKWGLREAVMQGNMQPLREADLSKRTKIDIIKATQRPPIVNALLSQSVTPEQALEAWSLMTPEEQTQTRPTIYKKLANAFKVAPAGKKRAILEQAQAVGFQLKKAR